MVSAAFFLYEDIQWGREAQIGFNAGDGFSSFSLPGALTEATLNADERSNVDHPGVFIYRIDSRPLHVSLNKLIVRSIRLCNVPSFMQI